MDAQLISAPRPSRLVTLLISVPASVLLAACSASNAPTLSPAATTQGSPTIRPSAAGTASPISTPVPTAAVTATPAATGTSAEGSLPDPCVLVNQGEAQAAVGTTLSPGSNDLFSRPDGTEGRSCYYDAPTGSGGLTFNIWNATAEQAAAYKEEQKQFGDVHDIAGLGDSAYRVGFTSLIVMKDDFVLEYGIEMAHYDPDTAQQNLMTLATTSLSRL